MNTILVDSLEDLSINIELEVILAPDDTVGVEIITVALGVIDSIVSIESSSMKGSVRMMRIFTNKFHDIDFTTSGPASLADVFTQHPESRPDSLTVGELCSHFDLSVLDREFTSSVDTGRGNVVSFFVGLDDEVTIFDVSVFGAVGIVFKLVVTPTISSGVMVPFVGVKRATVEFITPDEFPVVSGSDSEGKD